MRTAERLILSGAGGAIGSAYLRRLLEDAKDRDREIVALFSSSSSLERAVLELGEDAARVVMLVLDLTSEKSVSDAMQRLPLAKWCVGVHAAASVSWTASYEDLTSLNVEGTDRFARFVKTTSCDARCVYVSSSFALRDDRRFKNGYERSKAESATLIRERHPDLEPVVFSCSLVAGDSTTGRISRFHGIYPFFHAIEAWEPPVLGCEAGIEIDLVPMDWVVEELSRVVDAVYAGSSTPDVNASAGTARVPFGNLVEAVRSGLNEVRRELGHREIGPISVAPFRRVEFLRRSARKWGFSSEVEPSAKRLERLLEGYRPYLETPDIFEPFGTKTEAPPLDAYVKNCVRYWRFHGPGRVIWDRRLRGKGAFREAPAG